MEWPPCVVFSAEPQLVVCTCAGLAVRYPLRLIYDPATGKSRGFGFCEYEDPETAMSAVRNLAGRELNGRQLRIDSAANAPGDGFRGQQGNYWEGMR